jgi:FAD synthase
MRTLLLGKVVHGDKTGRELGFPTANLELYQNFSGNVPADKLEPGVYTCTCLIPDYQLAADDEAPDQTQFLRPENLPATQELALIEEHAKLQLGGEVGLGNLNFKRVFAGLLHCGPRSTLGESDTKWEVHLLNFDADIYGLTMAVCVRDFIRPTAKFESLDALLTHMIQDKHDGERLLFS